MPVTDHVLRASAEIIRHDRGPAELIELAEKDQLPVKIHQFRSILSDSIDIVRDQ
jgi:hypothetical protein